MNLSQKWVLCALPVWISVIVAGMATSFYAHSEHSGVTVEKLLETEKSWDGTYYRSYPSGTPQLSVNKITVPPYTTIPWHEHPVINVGYIMSGSLTVEKKSDGAKRILKAGDVLPEMVDIVHRGYTGEEGAVIIVFYAGKKGVPLSIPGK